MEAFIMGFCCGVLFAAIIISIVFVFYLKEKKEREQEMLQGSGQTEEQRYSMSFKAPQVKLLLVDDSRLSRQVIKDFLQQTGVEIAEVNNGAECLRMVKENRYDLIFMDLVMPKPDGLETCKRLKTEENLCKDVPVVLVSTKVKKENEAWYEENGFAGCMVKPVRGNLLEALLLRLLPQDKLMWQPEGFSYQNGLKYFYGNEEVYRETMLLFAQLWKEREVKLTQFLQEENLSEYAILIHGIKGDARTLGADMLAQMALEQEQQAKAGEIEKLRAGVEPMLMLGRQTAEYFERVYHAEGK